MEGKGHGWSGVVKKTDEERLRELDEKIKQIEEKKRQVKARLSQKERKARTKRLIEVGAIFERYFGIEGPEDAEKVASALQKTVDNNRNVILKYSILRNIDDSESKNNRRE